MPAPMDVSTRPYVLLGVMSNPIKPTLRKQWREWATTFHAHTTNSVRVRYVFGRTVYEPHVDPGPLTAQLPTVSLEQASSGQDDHLFVDGEHLVWRPFKDHARDWLAAAQPFLPPPGIV